jgi:hypothetical protein
LEQKEVEPLLLLLPATNPNCGDSMTEKWTHAVLALATLLGARKLIDTMESGKPNMAREYWTERAIKEVTYILEEIDKRWSTK